MRVCHESTVVFDEANLVSCAGLAPVLATAERAGLHEHLDEHLTLGAENASLRAASLVAGTDMYTDVPQFSVTVWPPTCGRRHVFAGRGWGEAVA